MKWSSEEIADARNMREKHGWTYLNIAEMLTERYGVERSATSVRNKLKRKGRLEHSLPDPDKVAERSTVSADGSTSLVTNRPHTDEEMAARFGVDMDEWSVTKRITNQWGENWQTKLWWNPNELNILRNNWDELLEEIRYQSSYATVPEQSSSDLVYEMCLFDAHFGSLAWGPETGEDYDLTLATQRYWDAFHSLLLEAPDSIACPTILLPVGNDLFHFDSLIDGKGGATFRGTPQDVDTRWQKLFVHVAAMMRELIGQLVMSGYMVDIVVVPGNHDTQTTFYLGELLDASFHNNERVRVDNTPRPRKYYRFGDVLLGFAHGHNEKIKDLYGLMTEEAGDAGFREWHLGHWHSEGCQEQGTMRIRTFPPLAGKDSWHTEKGFRTIPGARGLMWSPVDGLLAQYYHHVPDAQRHTHPFGTILTERNV